MRQDIHKIELQLEEVMHSLWTIAKVLGPIVHDLRRAPVNGGIDPADEAIIGRLLDRANQEGVNRDG